MSVGGPIGYQIVRGFDALDAARWDGLPLDGFYTRSPWLRSVEGALSAESAFVVARDASGRAIGGLVAYPVSSTFFYLDALELMLGSTSVGILKPHFSRDEWRRVERLVEEIAPLIESARPTATAVVPFGYANPLGHGGSGEVAEVLLDGLQKVGREWGTRSTALLYLPDAEDPVGRASLEARGYVSTLIEARAVLPVRWNRFEDYVASLGTNRRHQVRKELRAIERMDLETLIVDGRELDRWSDVLAPLAAALMAKYGNPSDVEREKDTFERVRRCLASFARVAVVRREGKPVCFALFYEADGVIYVSFSGNDYSTQHAHFLASYYAPVAHAIRSGAVALDYGMGAHQTKVHRGCRLQPQRGFLGLGTAVPAEVKELLERVEAAQRRRFAARVGS